MISFLVRRWVAGCNLQPGAHPLSAHHADLDEVRSLPTPLTGEQNAIGIVRPRGPWSAQDRDFNRYRRVGERWRSGGVDLGWSSLILGGGAIGRSRSFACLLKRLLVIIIRLGRRVLALKRSQVATNSSMPSAISRAWALQRRRYCDPASRAPLHWHCPAKAGDACLSLRRIASRAGRRAGLLRSRRPRYGVLFSCTWPSAGRSGRG